MRFAILLVASAAVFGQTPGDPTAVLERARARLQAMAHDLEKYVCVETVNRSSYRLVESRETASCGPAGDNAGISDPNELEYTDRVRLEVTLSDGRELHSWPGATRFDTRNIDEIIRDGPVSTGSFGGYLTGIFASSGVAFQYNSTLQRNGKTVFEYRYRVPLEASHFQIKVGSNWLPAAYEGEIQINPESLELERLTVRTNELPAGAPFCSAATTLEYELAHVGDSDILLPRQSQLDILIKSGRQTRNTITFSNCREYQAESEIVFGAPEPASTAAPATGRGRVALPIGLPVTLSLVDPIDSATAAAGDPVTATVVKPVLRAGSREVLIPAGAQVRGRIRRVEHYLWPEPYFRIAASFNRVETGGIVSPFFARHEADPQLAKELDANVAPRDTGIWFWGVGTFLFPSKKDHMTVPAGFESKWFTLDAGLR
ncbi:MAG: hypothetical protein P4L56_29860 [Candidatus Sulfopaludibacter sp.]|nr:hypothetical protein [Candidatus Sulfopaludibacter sp.]